MQFTATTLLALAATVQVAMSVAVSRDTGLLERSCPKQDTDPRGILCKVNEDCPDKCYPTCICAGVQVGEPVGVKPLSIYMCGKSPKVNAC